ncbi:hypothetical protein [Burkholderia gladioli]|uniref:hypothetical protein n=1 Tax=Burkholderia gladioli TaxID=28095 RepID=UPI002FE3F2AD
MEFNFQPTKWFKSKQPVFAGEYEAELSNGDTQFVKYAGSGWENPPANVVRWRGNKIRLSDEQRKSLKQIVHEGRHAALKTAAQEAALWLARHFVVRAARGDLSDERILAAKRAACGWYQIAHRLGVDMTANGSTAWAADKQALTMFWPELPVGARERITQIADGFKDGSGDRLSFD